MFYFKLEKCKIYFTFLFVFEHSKFYSFIILCLNAFLVKKNIQSKSQLKKY